MTRFSFPCPGSGVPISGTYDPQEETLHLHVSHVDLEGLDTGTANAAVEFCKTQFACGVTWEEARQHLIKLGVDPSDL
jgi:hypothetical protein